MLGHGWSNGEWDQSVSDAPTVNSTIFIFIFIFMDEAVFYRRGSISVRYLVKVNGFCPPSHALLVTTVNA